MPKGIPKKTNPALYAKKPALRRSKLLPEPMITFNVPVHIPVSVVLKAFYTHVAGRVPANWKD